MCLPSKQTHKKGTHAGVPLHVSHMPTKPQTFILLGHPVRHSLSPRMMNAAFKHLKLNAVYRAVDCKKSELREWIKKIRSGEIAGANVTMPYKEVVIKHLDKLTPAAKKIGAVNVIYRRGNKVVGDNTDGKGFVTSLSAVGAGFSRPKNEGAKTAPLRSKRIIVIGTGGAAKAICHALVDAGISDLTIVNRSHKHVKLLTSGLPSQLQHFNTQTLEHFLTLPNFQPKADPPTADNTLFINATPLGTPGCPWPSLDFVKHLPKNTIVFDIVTHPAETPLIKAAKRRGLQIIYGREMLLHQGAAAFERWMGRKAPVAIMRRAILP